MPFVLALLSTWLASQVNTRAPLDVQLESLQEQTPIGAPPGGCERIRQTAQMRRSCRRRWRISSELPKELS
jgi:hypothetical protein